MIDAVNPVDGAVTLASMVGDSPEMRAVKDLLVRVATSRASPVLVVGEPGVGKDLAARVIHRLGEHASQPFSKIACSDLRVGADIAPDARGTVLLDEVGDIGPALQVELLRFVETRHDLRVIVSTTGNLKEKVSDGTFRADLYYRLQMMPIAIPPVRERRGDVPLLAGFFIDLFNRELRKGVRGPSAEALADLEGYRWPGNVREVRNAIERAMLLATGTSLEPEDFAGISAAGGRMRQIQLPREGVNLEEIERQLLVQALERAGGNQTHAGQLLGINRDQVRYRIEKFGLQLPGHERVRPGSD